MDPRCQRPTNESLRLRPYCDMHHLDLHIRRTGPAEFIFYIRPAGPRSIHHSQPKLRRWATAILLASPSVPIGTELAIEPPLSLRHAPPFRYDYVWLTVRPGRVIGTRKGPHASADASVHLLQSEDGIHWFFISSLPELVTPSTGDRSIWDRRMRQHGVVFYSHPRHHRFPWAVAETVGNPYIRSKILR